MTLPPNTMTLLENIQKRVLWLATNMVHYANNIRPNPEITKVGGHQASSASMVTILTALYFAFLRQDDRISIKPHASPVFHAIQYLLGQLPRDYLTQLRAYGGLQSYPSLIKDPDHVDFSTGSVGLGAVAPAFAALADQYVNARFDNPVKRRFVAVIGDAELDEGNIWEAIIDEPLTQIGNLLWIVDVNRQSLDRVIPGIKAARLKRLFADCGWQVLEAKYGTRLQTLFAMPGGHKLRDLIDEMRNETYQGLIGLAPQELRQRLVTFHGGHDDELATLLATVDDQDLSGVIQNLGGHDFQELLRRFDQAQQWTQSPTIIFAYTIKGWGLPIAGDPLNHSKLLTQAQIDDLRQLLSIPTDDEWSTFAPESPENKYIAQVSERLYAHRPMSHTDSASLRQRLPETITVPSQGSVSTQQTFGRILSQLAALEALSPYIVTASPDVSVSTHIFDWVKKVGRFSPHEVAETETQAWAISSQGQHIELGISEMNLFMLLAMFGLSAELIDQPLIPIGTVYDPFVCRGLDSFIYGAYSQSKFIIAGTPSGVTLAAEGGAHQSTITSSIGIELPNLHYFEPCYAQETAWIMHFALGECLDREHGRATYLRLSTKPVDQQPFNDVVARVGDEKLRAQVLAGGYRLLDWRSVTSTVYREYMVHIVTTGAMIPEAIEAARLLHEEGVAANVLHLTSPRRIYEAWKQQAAKTTSLLVGSNSSFNWLIPMNERYAPVITVNDGASHALAWFGGIFGAPVIPLGVDEFGQSGTRASLYQHFHIDAQGIADAAFTALERQGMK